MRQYFLVGQTVSYIKKFIMYVNKSILPFPQVSSILKLKKPNLFASPSEEFTFLSTVSLKCQRTTLWKWPYTSVIDINSWECTDNHYFTHFKRLIFKVSFQSESGNLFPCLRIFFGEGQCFFCLLYFPAHFFYNVGHNQQYKN